MTVKIAVVQQDSRPGQVRRNREKALRFASQALAGGADIVLFHEELLVGYVENARELAEEADGPTTRAFRELLKGTDALILYGLTERDRDRFYISATLVAASGVVANYRKTHLWWKSSGLRHEPHFYSPGERWVTFDVRGHRSGVMICYDGDFPETARSYAKVGCTMLFWLNNRESRSHEEVRPLAAANSLIIAASCCVGENEMGDFCRGGSNVTDMDGSLLAEIWDEEGVIFAEVEPGRVGAAREANPWFTGRRDDLYL